MSQPRFKLSLVLTFASGAAALAHETLWTRRLVDVLGASAETFSKVVGAFFLGLALGAWMASGKRISSRAGWLAVAAAELAVGLLAVPVLFSATWSESLFSHPALVPWWRWLLPIALVVPPAMAMGTVLPWLLGALSRQEKQSVNFAVWIYATNTFGGIAGVAAVLLAPAPELGLTRMGLLVCGINLLVAAAATILHFSSRAGGSRVNETKFTDGPESAPAGSPGFTRGLAFASGFLVLSLEVLLQHQLAQVTVNSQFSSGTVLGLVLLALVFATAILPGLAKRLGEAGALRGALLAAAMLCAAQPFLLTWMRDGVTCLPLQLTALPYTLEVLKLGAVAVCPAVAAAGLIFPLLLRGQPGHSGRRIGRLLAWNGLGGWLGTEFTQSVLAPKGGLWTSVEFLAAVYLVLWGMVEWRWTRNSSHRPKFKATGLKPFVALVPLAALVFCFGAVRNLPQATILRSEHLAAVKVGREGVVATVERAPGDWRMLFNNSYTLGGSRPQFNQERQGLLPLLLHGHPAAVATLGVATGSTAAGVALDPGVERIDAIELSALVLRYAEEFFTPYNRKVFQDPRARFIHEDARWTMARERQTYDVVVGDLFVPWRTGEGRLFTLDHFRNVRRALKPDGLYCQWLPLFQLTRRQFDTIGRTFREVFPEVFLVRGDFYCEQPIVGLVGGRELGKIDWRAVAAGCQRLRAAGAATDPLVRQPEGVAMMVLGSLPDPGAGPINRLANSWLEWDAGRNILGLRTPWFLGLRCEEYLREIQRAGNPLLPDQFREAQESGQYFLRLGLASKIGLPETDDLAAQIPQRLPKSMRDDPNADWRQWPSRVRLPPQFLTRDSAKAKAGS